MNRFVLTPLSLATGLLAWYGLPTSGLEARANEPAAIPETTTDAQPRDVPSSDIDIDIDIDTVQDLEPPIGEAPALQPVQPAPAPLKEEEFSQSPPPPVPEDAPNLGGVPGDFGPAPTAGKNRYVDRNSYGSFDPSELPPLLPPAIDLTERSTGCQTTLVEGQLIRATCQSPTNLTLPAPPPLPNLQDPVAAGDLPAFFIDGEALQSSQTVSLAPSLPGLPPNLPKPKPAPPPRLNPANYVASALSAATNAISRRTPKLKLPGNGDRAVLYPLAAPGRISSLFGWRIHPIFGNRRFHSGTDIAAPHGTPVLAAYSGRVETAGYLSGYGLTVILRHADDTQESRYAHLSEISVSPGTWVAQGTEIGRVGNTGNSTGPHLHFEWRQRQGSQWVAVDAGEHLQGDGHGVVSLQPYRADNRADAGSEPTGAIDRAGWYVLPTVPPIGRLTARPLTLALWAPRFEEDASAVSSGLWPLPPAFITLFRWQPLQVFPPATEEEISSEAPAFLVDRRELFY